MEENASRVEFFSARDKERCSYCKSESSSIASGLWALSISDVEYQILVDRGFRRCGTYLFKNVTSETCCPMYTIRCDVTEAKISKSQKKVLKKFHNHLRFGHAARSVNQLRAPLEHSSIGGDTEVPAKVIPSQVAAAGPQSVVIEKSELKTPLSEKVQNSPDLSVARPQPKKAKLIRLDNKVKQLRKRGMSEEEAVRLAYRNKTSLQEKSFEDYFPGDEDSSHNSIHNFKTDLVPVSHLEDDQVLLEETYKLYMKYQMAVHGDPPDMWTMEDFVWIIVDSPIYDSHSNEGPPCGFGTFHQQYWLDDKLIAVGVIDVLPKCLSSVYFFYDPDFKSLSLGTYGCLREIFYTRSLMAVYPSIKYYYLGYYIHSCPKMAYKVNYHPSYLLCPETYTWHPVEKCLPMLDQSKYARFETDLSVRNELQCEVNLKKVMILYKCKAMDYCTYKNINSSASDEEEVTEYARLVGEECCQTLLLFRK
ncbi:arginyl-tRNA--protein transferase 1-like [Ischnura elegans]|uniref:arginyl-tRNA--protein transferase 1-like n=1 Tax=Ischnura elegans TaxID=197161 RepID=UPI001ED8B165|nr:arginyl-tRNA--protein transferase 1-like [Ischnura elegans]XP_046387468.1 arginyl-tRNA--protein transferase 1-like [Ischnura elegans]XP_046387469.1 arginyl-tRNA--protein transferase 1-like [Ischnura elegans]